MRVEVGYMKKLLVIVIAAIICLSLVSIVSGTENPAPGGGDVFMSIMGPFHHNESAEEMFDRISFFDPVQKQIFSEGSLEWGFETWITVYNSSATDAMFSILVSGPKGYLVSNPEIIGPHERLTYDINQFDKVVPGALGHPLDVAVEVYASTPEVRAQESMYWNDRKAGHTNTGYTVEL